MKRIIELILCISMSCVFMVNVNIIHATEDVVLSNFNETSVVAKNQYQRIIELCKDKNNSYNEYKEYDLLYQQNTGINTLSSLNFDVNINGHIYNIDNTNSTGDVGNGYQLTVTIENNPANDKSFLKNPKDFTIKTKFVLTNKNSGESVTVNKDLKAKVVKVIGKIINRKANYEIEKCLELQDIGKYLNKVHESLKVELLDGSIIDVIGCFGQGGSADVPNGGFYCGLSGVYDLKYLLEDATDLVSLNTFLRGYLIDKDNNIVNLKGEIVVAFKDRKLTSITSNNTEINLKAKVGTIPDSAVLESKKRTNLNLESQYAAYDINLFCNGEYIQPIGNLDLTIKIPDYLLNKNLGVFYMDEKGKLDELVSTIKGDEAIFSTNHLSTYVLMEKVEKPTKPNDPDKSNENNSTENTSPKTTVNTGVTTTASLFIALLVVSASIMVVLKKKKMTNN